MLRPVLLLLLAVAAYGESRLISYPGIGPQLFEISQVNGIYREVTRDGRYRVVSFVDTSGSTLRWTLLVDRDRDDSIDVMIQAHEARVEPAYQQALRQLAFRITARGLRGHPSPAQVVRQHFPDLKADGPRLLVVLCDEGVAIGANGSITEYPMTKARRDGADALARAQTLSQDENRETAP